MEERESIQRLGGDLVVFYNAGIGLIETWQRHADGLPDDLVVVADARATLYKDLGTRRKSGYLSLLRGSVGPALTSARQGILPKPTRADMLRLGADAAVGPDGEIVTLHLAETPDDRVPMTELVAALS